MMHFMVDRIKASADIQILQKFNPIVDVTDMHLSTRDWTIISRLQTLTLSTE